MAKKLEPIVTRRATTQEFIENEKELEATLKEMFPEVRKIKSQELKFSGGSYLKLTIYTYWWRKLFRQRNFVRKIIGYSDLCMPRGVHYEIKIK